MCLCWTDPFSIRRARISVQSVLSVVNSDSMDDGQTTDGTDFTDRCEATGKDNTGTSGCPLAFNDFSETSSNGVDCIVLARSASRPVLRYVRHGQIENP